ncbi:sulfate permease [Rothia uropygioeca]|uniref:sulfate permease n=1 Tax=Kocuria sp. 257 TaxID=2021970 RepID=UPI0010112960|nr:sulfate permease [Kocuria sp. 257]
MFRLIWITSIHLAGFFRRVMPTNILLDKIRTRSGLKWGVPAMLVAIPYLYAASLLTVIIQDGGPGWLNILVLIALWSALKMLWSGPVSLVLLTRVRWQERSQHRAQQRQLGHQEWSPEVVGAPVLAGGAS